MTGYGKSVVGRIRKNNEDAILVNNDPFGAVKNLYIVADGMGGHLAGEIASGLAVSEMREYLMNNTGSENMLEILADAAEAVNKKVYLRGTSDESLYGMGTTLLAATIRDETAYIVNIGDSRLYIINTEKNEITQITVDHSYVNELLLRGKITAEEAETRPDRNIITRALGIGPDVKCDRFTYKMERGDMVLMCSDGLSNMISNKDILKICTQNKGIEEKLEALVDGANERGGVDNISVILYGEDNEVR